MIYRPALLDSRSAAPLSRMCGATSRGPPGRTGPMLGRRPSLARQRLLRRRASAFALQRPQCRARPSRRRPSPPAARAARRLRAPLGRALRARRRLPEMNAGAPRFRQPNRDRLLRRSRAVLALTDVVHLFANELTSLRRRRLPLPFIAPRALQRRLFRHSCPPRARREQCKCHPSCGALVARSSASTHAERSTNGQACARRDDR